MSSAGRSWMETASCTAYPPEWFFPELPGIHGARQRERAAAICDSCPVIENCRAYRKATNSGYGVWAGETYSTAGTSDGGPRRRTA